MTTGDIPAELQTAANNKQFAQQVEAYKIAKARVAQYQLSVGVPESSETIVTGQEWNEEAMEMQDVTETVVTPAIPALRSDSRELRLRIWENRPIVYRRQSQIH